MRIAMLCPCGKRSLDTPPILDIEKILQDYAWRDFKEKSGPVEKIFLRRRDFDIEVPMNYFHFEDSETILRQRTTKTTLPTAAGHCVPETAVLSTQFRNNTQTQQTYKFRVERTRKATLSVTFQRGFSIGGKAHFKLELPKVAGTSGDIDMRLQISKTTGETFEESMTFEVNSDITVNEHSNYTANVAFTEKEISAGFTVFTTMRMPTGTAPITIRRKRDRELYATIFVGNLKEVFDNYKSFAEAIDESPEDSRCSDWAIKFTTTGIVEGIRLSGQKIYLDSTKLKSTDTPAAVDEAQLQAALISGAIGARHQDVFGTTSTSESDDNKEDSSKAGKPLRTITDGHSETRILKGPQIPTIITTAPSSQESTSPSDTGTNTSGETQSLPEEKPDKSPSPVSSPAPSPGKTASNDGQANQSDSSTPKESNAQNESKKVPLKETKSLSRGSKDDSRQSSQDLKSPTSLKSMPELRSPSPSGKTIIADVKPSSQVSKQEHDETKPTKKHKVMKEDSITRLDPTRLKAEPQKFKIDSQKVKDLSRFRPDPIKIPNIKDAPFQYSNPKHQTAKELMKQRSDPKELMKQMTHAKDLMKQISNPEGEKIYNDDRDRTRRSYRHETLERMERVSSLSERPRILPKSGSLPRATVHSPLDPHASNRSKVLPKSGSLPRASGHSPVEPQSSEEDSTSSLNKLSKCTSV